MAYAVEQGVLQAPRAMELGSEAEEEADVLQFKRRARD
jgi:hypothetical protein